MAGQWKREVPLESLHRVITWRRTMKASIAGIVAEPFVPVEDLKRTPGHLVRRCQQIAVAIFLEEFESTRLTSVQFAALITIAQRPGLDQSARRSAPFFACSRSAISSGA